jgi:hypothetical protein
VSIGHANKLSLLHASHTAFDNAPNLHVAQKGDRKARGRLSGVKDAQMVIPTGMQIGVRGFVKGQLCTCGKARVEGFKAKVALWRWAFFIAEEVELARRFYANRAYDAYARHK